MGSPARHIKTKEITREQIINDGALEHVHDAVRMDRFNEWCESLDAIAATNKVVDECWTLTLIQPFTDEH